MSAASAFRSAVEAGDIDAAVGLLADDVTFRSPAVFTPYERVETVSRLLTTVFGVFEDFRYVEDMEGGGAHALIFEARVGDKQIQGLDLIRENAAGEISEFTVMVRPASGLMALAGEMSARLSA